MGRKFSAEQVTNTVTTLGAGTKFIVLTTTPENKFITSENIAADTIFTSAFQAKDAGLTSIAGLTTAADKMVYTTASDVYATTSLSAFARTILDDADAATVRATIGVDASGTDNSTNVSLAGALDYITLVGQVLTRNAIDLTTDTTGTLAVASGGTGLTSISTLLNSNVTPSSLGLVIGTNVQAYDAGLQALADLANGSGVLTNNGSGVLSWAAAGGTGDALVANPLSQFASTTSLQLQGVMSDETGTGSLVFATAPTFASIADTGVVSAGTWQGGVVHPTYGGTGLTSISTLLNSNVTPATLGLVIGTNTQAYDATLTSIALLGTASDKLAYTTAIDTWAETPLTAFARTILDDSDAATVRATIGVDASGVDNSTNVTLVTTTADYLSIAGQAITLGLVDLSTDVTGSLATGTVPWAQLTSVPSTFAPSAHTLNSHSDVTITTITSGELLKWNGTGWVNNTLSEAGISAVGHSHAASDITSGTFDDARIKATNVTQHEGVITISSSQISDKASANGVASLDAGGKVPSAQLPLLALTEVFVAVSEAAQLALAAQEGDVVVRTDESKSYIHNGGTAGTMADYTELQTPTDAVTSVNGYTGTVSLTTSDVGEGTNLYYTSGRFDTAFSGKDTDDLTEGATNQYFTNARSRSAISLTTTNSSELSYDSGTGVFSYVSPTTVADANSVTLEVRNTTGSTIPKGAAVYISGHSGTKILIDLADSDVSGKYPAIGLAAGAIANNSDGEVTVYGELAGVDTSSYSVGDILYLSSTAGALTNTRPTSNADAVQNIGKVARADNNGIIIVSGSGRANDIPNLANTHVFIGGASGNEQRALAAGDILSGTFADARISQSSVTQHQAAISITESQVSDLGNYVDAGTALVYSIIF